MFSVLFIQTFLSEHYFQELFFLQSGFHDRFYVHFRNMSILLKAYVKLFLAFFAVGSKYNPKELFDITRRTATSAGDDASLSARSDSYLQVQVPCDLIRRSTIAVSIEIG